MFSLKPVDGVALLVVAVAFASILALGLHLLAMLTRSGRGPRAVTPGSDGNPSRAMVTPQDGRRARGRRRPRRDGRDGPPLPESTVDADDTDEKEDRQQEGDDGVPIFRVVALGTSGSGKTVFLASLFHVLRTQSDGREYFLKLSLDDDLRLQEHFVKIADTGQPWSRGTGIGESQEFVFDCMSLYNDVMYLLFKIHYIDYAGDLLQWRQGSGSTALPDLERNIDRAHAVWLMLDGHKVLKYLRGDREGLNYINIFIRPMLGKVIDSSCPVQFVLTKWDIVRGFGESEHADENTRLRLVRERLLQNGVIDRWISMYGSARGTLRLIPVSALGSDFATLDSKGNVVKVEGAEVRPSNVDFPIAAVIPDLFRQVEEKLPPHLQARIVDILRAATTPRSAVAAVARIVMGSAVSTLKTVLTANFGAGGVQFMRPFLDWLGRYVRMQVTTIRDERDEVKKQTALFHQARRRVFVNFTDFLRDLERKLPASILKKSNRPWDS